MKLRPKDIQKLKRLRSQMERQWLDLDDPKVIEDSKALADLMESEGVRKNGKISVSIPEDIATRAEDRISDGVVDIGYGIRVIFSVYPTDRKDAENGLSRHLSVSRNGQPKIPQKIQKRLLALFGFPEESAFQEVGRGLHAYGDITELEMDA